MDKSKISFKKFQRSSASSSSRVHGIAVKSLMTTSKVLPSSAYFFSLKLYGTSIIRYKLYRLLVVVLSSWCLPWDTVFTENLIIVATIVIHGVSSSCSHMFCAFSHHHTIDFNHFNILKDEKSMIHIMSGYDYKISRTSIISYHLKNTAKASNNILSYKLAVQAK